MKLLSEMNCYCGDCEVREYCNEGTMPPCVQKRFQDITIEEYKEIAKAVIELEELEGHELFDKVYLIWNDTKDKPIMNVKCGGHKPSYANEYAAGLDIRANNDVTIYPGETADVETKLAIEIPEGYFGMVVARSGLGFKHRITLVNDVGIIDEDYRGDIGLRLINDGKESYEVNSGDRVAQMIIVPYIQTSLSYVKELAETVRGKNGFGSTGK